MLGGEDKDRNLQLSTQIVRPGQPTVWGPNMTEVTELHGAGGGAPGGDGGGGGGPPGGPGGPGGGPASGPPRDVHGRLLLPLTLREHVGSLGYKDKPAFDEKLTERDGYQYSGKANIGVAI